MYTEWKWGESEEFDSNIMSTESCIQNSHTVIYPNNVITGDINTDQAPRL